MFYFSLEAAQSPSVWEKISAWYQGSVIYELLQYFEQTYFTVSFGAYEHFQFSPNAGELARNVIFALAIALVIASALAVYSRKWVGKLVRELVRLEVHSPENAKTLLELGFFCSVAIRHELKRGYQLRRLVLCREKEAFLAAKREEADKKEQSSEFVLDFTTAHFYIPEELRQSADVRFEKKGFGWLQVLITAIAAIVLAGLACYFLPDLIQLADNIISLMSPQ